MGPPRDWGNPLQEGKWDWSLGYLTTWKGHGTRDWGTPPGRDMGPETGVPPPGRDMEPETGVPPTGRDMGPEIGVHLGKDLVPESGKVLET